MTVSEKQMDISPRKNISKHRFLIFLLGGIKKRTPKNILLKKVQEQQEFLPSSQTTDPKVQQF
jgi:hypothetical protein